MPSETRSPRPPSILVVSDDGEEAADLVARLHDLGYAARAATATAWSEDGPAGANPADLALVDLTPAGVEAAQSLGNGSGTATLYLTDGTDAELLRRARENGPCGYVAKPVATTQLRLSLDSALAERERAESERALRRRFARLQSRERLLTTILDGIGDGVVATDGSGNYVYHNPAVRQIMEGDLPELEMERRLVEWGYYRLDRKTPMPAEETPLARILRGEEVDDGEFWVQNDQIPDGKVLSVVGRPTRFGDGSTGAVIVLRDVTAVRDAEATLQRQTRELEEHAALLDAIYNSMSEGIVVVGEEGRMLHMNRAGEDLVGIGMLDVDPAEWAETYGIFEADQRTPLALTDFPLVRALQGETVDEGEYFIRNEQRPAGIHIMGSARPLRRGDEIIGAIGVMRDISQQKASEAELRRALRETRERSALVDAVLARMSDGCVVVNGMGEFEVFNQAAENIVGVGGLAIPPDEWTEAYGLFHPDSEAHIATEDLPLARAMMGKPTVEMEILVRNENRPDGVYLSVNGAPLPGEGDQPSGGIAVFRDVTEHRELEQAREGAIAQLRQQTELLEAVFDGINDGIVVTDSGGAVLHVNKAAVSITGDYGRTEAPPEIRAADYGVYYPDRKTPVPTQELPVLRAAMRGETVTEEDCVLMGENREDAITVRVSARPLLHADGSRRGAVAIMRDVTELRRAEEALSEAFAQGKIEIIDTILHNVGNAVNSVATGIETIHRQLHDDTLTGRLQALVRALEDRRGDWADYIENDPQGRLVLPFVIALSKDLVARDERIRSAAERAKGRSDHIAEIIRTQRAFKKQAASAKEVDLHQNLRVAVGLLEHSIADNGIEVEIDCEEAPKVISTQESDLQQMLVNLVSNSIDALKTRRTPKDTGWVPRMLIRSYVRKRYLVIEVEDNGIGIPEDKLVSIFAAGFTTKRGGTGLGLHSAATFVRRSGGSIQAFSDGVGRGARVRAKMPMSSLSVPKAGAGAHPRKPRAPRGRQE